MDPGRGHYLLTSRRRPRRTGGLPRRPGERKSPENLRRQRVPGRRGAGRRRRLENRHDVRPPQDCRRRRRRAAAGPRPQDEGGVVFGGGRRVRLLQRAIRRHGLLYQKRPRRALREDRQTRGAAAFDRGRRRRVRGSQALHGARPEDPRRGPAPVGGPGAARRRRRVRPRVAGRVSRSDGRGLAAPRRGRRERARSRYGARGVRPPASKASSAVVSAEHPTSPAAAPPADYPTARPASAEISPPRRRRRRPRAERPPAGTAKSTTSGRSNF